MNATTTTHRNRVDTVRRYTTECPHWLPDAAIIRAWERCLQRHQLRPEALPVTPILSSEQIDNRRQRFGAMWEVIAREMHTLYQQLGEHHTAIVLADSEGVILAVLKHDDLHALPVNGEQWSEAIRGTNAIGLCLAEQEPAVVYGDDHFAFELSHLSTVAAPIFDAHGRLQAVLAAVSAAAVHSRRSQLQNLALLTLATRLMENGGFLQQFQRHWVLRFHAQPAFIGLLSEGLLAFDDTGRLLAINQSGLEQLHLTDRRSWLGQSIERLFEPFDWRNRPQLLPPQLNLVRRFDGQSLGGLLCVPDQPTCNSEPATAGYRVELHDHPHLENDLEGLEGGDPTMAQQLKWARRVMNRGINLLVLGETGTGKEAVARAIHNASNRQNKPFVAVNCAALPEMLIESELFGYKHGAFTGARREGMRGKILQSSGGTLFLDEIGDMPVALQTRLLRVLEEGEVLPLGSEVPVPVTLHVISATHRRVLQRVADGEFREDLYYRLNGLTLTLPSLRERLDRAALIRRVMAQESENLRVQLAPEAFAALMNYTWPGNLRQLHNVLRTAVALCEHHIIRLDDLPQEMRPRLPLAETPLPSQDLLPSASTLVTAEKQGLLQELENQHWNITNTASHLGMSRNTLYRKMKKHGINPPTLA